ncbi:DUF7238 family protein [Serratia quinivorans]
MSAIKRLFIAANLALDEIDRLKSEGYEEPSWAAELRAAISEMGPPAKMKNEEQWQRFIRIYAEEIGPTPTAYEALLLQLFKEAGDALPVDVDAAWLFSAWRKIDIIYARGLSNKDMIVWLLLHDDQAIQRLIKRFWPRITH